MISFLFNFLMIVILFIAMAVIVINGAGLVKVSFDYWFGGKYEAERDTDEVQKAVSDRRQG